MPALSKSTSAAPPARGSKSPRSGSPRSKTSSARVIGDDLELIISEIGVTADWSAAYTPNAGPMDAVVKVQLTEEREHSAQEYVAALRDAFRQDRRVLRTWSSPSTPAA